jgi:hypothetical protein
MARDPRLALARTAETCLPVKDWSATVGASISAWESALGGLGVVQSADFVSRATSGCFVHGRSSRGWSVQPRQITSDWCRVGQTGRRPRRACLGGVFPPPRGCASFRRRTVVSGRRHFHPCRRGAGLWQFTAVRSERRAGRASTTSSNSPRARSRQRCAGGLTHGSAQGKDCRALHLDGKARTARVISAQTRFFAVHRSTGGTAARPARLWWTRFILLWRFFFFFPRSRASYLLAVDKRYSAEKLWRAARGQGPAWSITARRWSSPFFRDRAPR